MAQRRKKLIPLVQGLETKVDPKVLPEGALTQAENVVFNKPGTLGKRHGYTSLSTDLVDSAGSLSGSTNIFAYDQQVLVSTMDDLLAFVPTQDAWKRVGALPPIQSNLFQVSTSSEDQRNPVSGIDAAGVTWHAWEQDGDVVLSAFDSRNDSPLVADTVVAVGTQPKLVRFGDGQVLFYLDSSTDLVMVSLTVANALAGTFTPADTLPDLGTGAYDAVELGDSLYVAFDSATADVTTFLKYASVFTSASADQSFDSGGFIDLSVQGSQVVCLALSSGSALNVSSVDTSLTQGDWDLLGATVPVSGSLTEYQKFSMLADDDAGSVFFQADHGTYHSYLTTGSTSFSTASLVQQNSFMVGKPIRLNGLRLVPTVNSASNNFSYRQHLVDHRGIAVGKSNVDVAGPRTTDTLPVAFDLSGSKCLAAERSALFETVREDGSPELGTFAVSQACFATGSVRGLRYHDALHFPGSVMRSYDGGSLTETNFLLYPEILCSTSSAGGSELSAGTYLYSFTYAWEDRLGRTHESTSAVRRSVTVPNDGDVVDFEVSNLTLTDKQNVRVIGYRSLERQGATSFSTPMFRFTPIDPPHLTSRELKFISIRDEYSDEVIQANKPLYATSQVDNDSPPACTVAAVKDNRIWVVSSDDPNQVHYSKESKEGEAVSFANSDAAFFFDVQDDDNEDVTALGSLDEKLVVFKPTRIYLSTGAGPDNAGNRNNLSDPRLLTSDAGCSNQDSVVALSLEEGLSGLLFQSNRGIQFLDAGDSVRYLGAPVEAYRNLSTVSAVPVPEEDQIRFLNSSSVGLVYDYRARQWATWTNHASVGSILIGSTYYRAQADGTVLQQNQEYNDDGAAIVMQLTTGWIHPNGVQEWGRLHKVWLLGERKADHDLTLKVGFNFNSTFEGTYSEMYDVDSVLAGSTSGSFQQEQLGMKMSRKCTAFRVNIIEVQSGSANQGCTFTALSFESSRRRGFNRLSEGARGKD